jgi:hypothetical protein
MGGLEAIFSRPVGVCANRHAAGRARRIADNELHGSGAVAGMVRCVVEPMIWGPGAILYGISWFPVSLLPLRTRLEDPGGVIVAALGASRPDYRVFYGRNDMEVIW